MTYLFSNKQDKYAYIITIAGMPPHHRRVNSSYFIIGNFTLLEDGQVMTETCRRFSKI